MLHTSIVPLSLWHSTGLEWSKITRVLVEKNRKGAIFLRPTLATRLPRVEKCFPRFPAAAVLVEVCFSVADTLLLLLAGDLKKVEFTATTNGLNSQLSLDKLKTNSCSLSKQRGGQQLFPNGHLVTVNLTSATIQPGGNVGNPHKQLPIYNANTNVFLLLLEHM